MAYTADWSNTIIIDHTKLNAVAAGMRATRLAVSERLTNMIYGFTSGETQTTEGIKNLPFYVQSGNPGATADKIKVYAKDVNAICELFIQDENANVKQIVGFRTGDKLFSSSTTTPNGFTDQSATYEGKNIRVSATALSTGGSDTLSGSTASYTLTTSDIPAHTHTIGKGDRTSPGSMTGGGSDSAYGTMATGSAGGGGGHSHSLSGISCINAFVTLKMYSKD